MLKHILILCFSLPIAMLASDQDRQIVKDSIKKHYKNQNIIFLHIKEMTDNNYFVIIRNNSMQERVEVDKFGKILSIIDDLNVVEEAEEGC